MAADPLNGHTSEKVGCQGGSWSNVLILRLCLRRWTATQTERIPTIWALGGVTCMSAGENQDEADPCGDKWGLSLHTGEDGRLLTLLTARTPSESQSRFFLSSLAYTEENV